MGSSIDTIHVHVCAIVACFLEVHLRGPRKLTFLFSSSLSWAWVLSRGMASEEERARGKGGVGGRKRGRQGGREGERETGREGRRERGGGGTLASWLLGFWLLLPGKEKL